MPGPSPRQRGSPDPICLLSWQGGSGLPSDESSSRIWGEGLWWQRWTSAAVCGRIKDGRPVKSGKAFRSQSEGSKSDSSRCRNESEDPRLQKMEAPDYGELE